MDRRLAQNPAVVLLGPRQVGKTTLAERIAARHPDAVVLDMERPSDRAAVAAPELFFLCSATAWSCSTKSSTCHSSSPHCAP